ncbi:MAG: hypothetical protein K6T83_08010 [Alicyclobacillus sp.]|nr:hypothetical protein [Alicyclobacillus sp.]
MFNARFKRITTRHPYGHVTLTVFTPQDADWIEQHLRQFPVDLHNVQSAIATIGDSFVVFEREIDQDTLHFAVQSYRPAEPSDDDMTEIHVDVLATYPI